MEKATESFRQALLYSDRHYNAWYGLGTIYYRQEKYELAECHFRRALAINPASSVLHCYLGECGYYVGAHSTHRYIVSCIVAPMRSARCLVVLVTYPVYPMYLCNSGMALHAQNNTIKTTEALDVLTRAAEKDPSNPQVLLPLFAAGCGHYVSILVESLFLVSM